VRRREAIPDPVLPPDRQEDQEADAPRALQDDERPVHGPATPQGLLDHHGSDAGGAARSRPDRKHREALVAHVALLVGALAPLDADLSPANRLDLRAVVPEVELEDTVHDADLHDALGSLGRRGLGSRASPQQVAQGRRAELFAVGRERKTAIAVAAGDIRCHAKAGLGRGERGQAVRIRRDD